MRILMHDYAGHAFTIELSRKIAARGHEVEHVYSSSVVSPRGTLGRIPSDPPGLTIEGIASPKSIPRTRFIQRMMLEREYAVRLQTLVGKVRPDVLICANTPSFVVAPVAGYCKQKGVRYVSWVQDLYGMAAYKILKRKLPGIGHVAGQYLMHLDRIALRASHAVICITEDFVDFVCDAGVSRDKIHVIHNWAPLEEIPERPRENVWSQRAGLADGVRFLYSGTLAMKHNPELLFRLAQAIATWGPGELIVISEGPGIEWLREKASKHGVTNLKLCGFQPFEDLPNVLGSADVATAILERDAGVFSVPSKVLSYLCAGRPMLAAMPAENLAARTVVLSGAGFVSDPDDIDGWLNNAHRLYNDVTLRNEMGSAGRKYAEEAFDTDAIATRFLDIINSPQSELDAPNIASITGCLRPL